MKVMSPASAQILQMFSSWNHWFLVYPSGRFQISYRKTKDYVDNAIVEGWLDDTFDEKGLYQMSGRKLGAYYKAFPITLKSKPYSPPRTIPISQPRVELIEEATSETVAVSFTLPQQVLRLAEYPTSKSERVFLNQKQEGTSFAKMDTVFSTDENGKTIAEDHKVFFVELGQEGSCSIELPRRLLSALPSGTGYQVQLLTDNYLIFSALDANFTIYARRVKLK